jgi:hypothetical protein
MNHYTQSLSEQEIYLADEQKLSDQGDEGDEGGDKIDHMTFRDFYKIVDDLKKQNPTFRAQDFKAFMKSDAFKDDYNEIVNSFTEDFGHLDLSNEYYKEIVIALSSIGIEIPQKPRVKNNSVNEDIEDEDKENIKNVVDNKIHELLSNDGILFEKVSEIK